MLAHGLPTVTLTSGGERPPASFPDQPSRLNGVRLAQLGRAAEQLLRWLDAVAELAPGTATYIYFGPRILPGWAIELVLIALSSPSLSQPWISSRAAGGGRSRWPRRFEAIAAASASGSGSPSFRAVRARGVWPTGRGAAEGGRAARPTGPSSGSRAGGPLRVGWLVARALLVPSGPSRRPRSSLARPGAARAGGDRLLVVATNPFALIFLLPRCTPGSGCRTCAAAVLDRVAVLARVLGPLLLLGSFAVRYGLGLDAPWYLAELVATATSGSPRPGIAVGWLGRRGAAAALTGPLRALPERPRTASARAAARGRPPDGAYS